MSEDGLDSPEGRQPGRVGCGSRLAACATILLVGGIIFVLSPELAPPATRAREIIARHAGWDLADSAGNERTKPESRVAVAANVPKASPAPKPAATARPRAPEPAPPSPEPPLPRRYIPYGRIETARIFNGVQLEARVQTEQGAVASKERESEPSYRVALDVRVNVPTPVDTVAGLARLNPGLSAALPGLERLVPTAKVSDFFHGLYERKVTYLHDQIARLDQLVTRHNFYDCETILELRDPETGRRALLIQGEMDVVADGSDGDRAGDVSGTSENFQPFTSYRWKKRTERPNPYLADRRRRLADAEREFAIKGLSAERNRQLRATIDQMRREIVDLERYSFLVAALDPFVVVPGFILRYPELPFAPRFGDLAAVVCGDRVYPALVGDAGPSYKSGEASLRIARAIDPKSDPYRRPVSDLSITYIVFPRTAIEPPGPPDLAILRARCLELFGEIGGLKGEMHDWSPPPAPVITNATPAAATNIPPVPATNAAPLSPSTNSINQGGATNVPRLAVP